MDKKMVTVYFNGETICKKDCGGNYVQGVDVDLPEEYTMNDLVRAIWKRGFQTFCTGNMKHLEKVPEWVKNQSDNRTDHS